MKKLIISAVILIVIIMAFKTQINSFIDHIVIEKFKRIFYFSDHGTECRYLGVRLGQNPCDNWSMQELLYKVKPDYLIETGTLHGGSALFYANVLERIGDGKVITVDIAPDIDERVYDYNLFKERVISIVGDSVSDGVLDQVREIVKGKKAFVTLDSWHDPRHVLKELNLYSPLVSVGSYIVVQDTNRHIKFERTRFLWRVFPFLIPRSYLKTRFSPISAVEKFLKTNKNFAIDTEPEYLLTNYPSGFLKRVK